MYTSNVQVIKISKFIHKINFDTSNNKYNFAKVFIDSNNSDTLDSNSNGKTLTTNGPTASDPILIIVACQENNVDNFNNLDKLYTLCERSKSTWVIKQNKNMIIITSKLEKVYVNL